MIQKRIFVIILMSFVLVHIAQSIAVFGHNNKDVAKAAVVLTFSICSLLHIVMPFFCPGLVFYPFLKLISTLVLSNVILSILNAK